MVTTYAFWSFKVVDFCIIRKPVYDFLLVIIYDWLKLYLAPFLSHTVPRRKLKTTSLKFDPQSTGLPSNFAEKFTTLK